MTPGQGQLFDDSQYVSHSASPAVQAVPPIDESLDRSVPVLSSGDVVWVKPAGAAAHVVGQVLTFGYSGEAMYVVEFREGIHRQYPRASLKLLARPQRPTAPAAAPLPRNRRVQVVTPPTT